MTRSPAKVLSQIEHHSEPRSIRGAALQEPTVANKTEKMGTEMGKMGMPMMSMPMGMNMGMGMMMVRCKMECKKVDGGMMMTMTCPTDAMAMQMREAMEMMSGGMCSMMMMMNGMPCCMMNLMMGTCMMKDSKMGMTMTCTSGDKMAAGMMQMMGEMMSRMMDMGMACCMMMNGMPMAMSM